MFLLFFIHSKNNKKQNKIVENPQHSDFIKLRRMLISTHMQDLKDTTQDVHYENFRAHCISQISHQALRSKKRESISSNDTISETDRLLLQKDEEVCAYVYFKVHFKFQFHFRYIENSITKHNSDSMLLLLFIYLVLIF